MADQPPGSPEEQKYDPTVKMDSDPGNPPTGEKTPRPHTESHDPQKTTKVGAGDSSGRTKKAGPSVGGMPEDVREALKLPQNRLGHYALVRKIGEGGMGAVWKAWDLKLDRWAAIKFLSTQGETDIQRFLREARVAAQLRHGNIVTVYEIDELNGRHYIAMEFVDGKGIDAVQLDQNAILENFVKVCEAVQHAHNVGIVHRDLKPANIMMSHEGIPYVTDFGLAKMLQTDSSISVSGQIMGTPVFMPPEQAKGEIRDVNEKSDVYSLGATLYKLLTKKMPFDAPSVTVLLMKVCTEEVVPPRKINPEIPEPIEAVVLKAMEKDPARRYQTAKEMGDDIKSYIQQGWVQARSIGFGTRMARKIKRNPWPFVAMLALLIAGGVVAGIFLTQKPEPAVGPGPDVTTPGVDPETAWRQKFEPLKSGLSYFNFRTKVPATVKEARALLAEMPEGLSGEVSSWFQQQAAQLPDSPWAKDSWLGRRPEAERILGWCSMIGEVIEGRGEEFDWVRNRVSGAQALLGPVAAYRGKVTLKVFTLPYAEVTSLKIGESWIIQDRQLKGNAQIVGEGLHTPLVIRDLDIGDGALTITGPKGKDHELTFKGEEMQDGGTYLFSGSLDKPASFRLRSP